MDANNVSVLDPAGLDPTITLVVAFLAMLGVMVPPIVVALINRTGRTAPAPDLDLIEDLDDINDRLTREVLRKDDQIERLTRENERLRQRLNRQGGQL